MIDATVYVFYTVIAKYYAAEFKTHCAMLLSRGWVHEFMRQNSCIKYCHEMLIL